MVIGPLHPGSSCTVSADRHSLGCSWMTAQVVEVYQNETDGLVRDRHVQTSSSEYDRLIQGLKSLENTQFAVP